MTRTLGIDREEFSSRINALTKGKDLQIVHYENKNRISIRSHDGNHDHEITLIDLDVESLEIPYSEPDITVVMKSENFKSIVQTFIKLV